MQRAASHLFLAGEQHSLKPLDLAIALRHPRLALLETVLTLRQRLFPRRMRILQPLHRALPLLNITQTRFHGLELAAAPPQGVLQIHDLASQLRALSHLDVDLLAQRVELCLQ